MLSLFRRQPSAPDPSPPPPRLEDDMGDLVRSEHVAAADRVTYASKSSNVKFVCSMPADSQHLAEARNLSLGIYTRRGAQPRSIEGRAAEKGQGSRLLTDRESVVIDRLPEQYDRNQNERRTSSERLVALPTAGETKPARRTSLFRVRGEKKDSPLESTRHRSSATTSQSTVQSVPQSQSRHSRSSGRKHTSATHETYVLEGGQGRTLFASAPIGSQAARYHDQVAAADKLEPRLLRE